MAGIITITMTEEGDVPSSFQIPASVAAKLDQYVADTKVEDGNGSMVPKYAGKADLFLQHNLATLLKPIVDKYPDPPSADVQAMIAQRDQLDQQISQALAVTPILVIQP